MEWLSFAMFIFGSVMVLLPILTKRIAIFFATFLPSLVAMYYLMTQSEYILSLTELISGFGILF